jgi:nucleotide-binding universal stress UspA family protein
MSDKSKPLTILLAVDGSEHARVATELVCSLPLPNGSHVTALAILDTPHTPRRQLLLAALTQTQEHLNKYGLTSEIGMLHGHPAEALTSFADEHQPDLIVLGAKGLRATLGILLGGVAQQVIEYAKWPVLIVRPPFMPIKRVLGVTDGSTFSQQALSFLLQFPLPKDTDIYLAYVVPPMPDYQAGSFSHTILSGSDALHPIPIELLEEVENWQNEAEETGKNILAESQETFNKLKFKVSSKLLHGDAATEILNYSKELKIDMIVAGSRGLSPVKGWLLGSVSHKHVHYADCSVLIVRV